MSFTIRKAVEDDCRTLFEWVNATDSLANKLQTASPISWPEHKKWFAARLADPTTHIYMLECDDEPLGQIRFQARGSSHDVDIYVALAHRQRGLARKALLACAKRFFEQEGAHKALSAVVMAHNAASQKLFERSGFRRVEENEKRIVFVIKGSELG